MIKLIKDTFYLKLAFIIVGLFTAVPFIYQKIEGGIKILLIWSIFVFGYTFFKNWKYLIRIEYILLILFCVSYVITIFINLGKHTVSEIMLLAYTGVFLFILTYCDKEKTKEDLKKELLTIFKCVVFITMVFSFVCIVMFIFSLNGTFVLRDSRFPYGMWENRLWGLYNPNTGAVLNYISLIMSLLLLKNFDNGKIWKKLLYCNIIEQSICFVLTQSRGAQVAFFAYIVIYFVFIHKYQESVKGKRMVLRKGMAAYCAIAVIILTTNISLSVLSYVPKAVGNIVYTKEEQEIQKNNLKRQKKDKTVESATSGRAGLWELGGKIYIENPGFGIGVQSITDAMKENFTEKWYKASKGGGLHSVYITVLASCGTVGSIMFVLFLCITAWKGFRFFMDQRKDIFEKCVVAFLPAWLIGDLVETRIILTTNFLAIIFWVFAGYAIYYFDKSTEGTELTEAE